MFSFPLAYGGAAAFGLTLKLAVSCGRKLKKKKLKNSKKWENL